MAALSIHERKRLRQIGHALNPVVMIGGQGLTENVIEETNRALNDHELIKVKIAGEDREDRAEAASSRLTVLRRHLNAPGCPADWRAMRALQSP